MVSPVRTAAVALALLAARRVDSTRGSWIGDARFCPRDRNADTEFSEYRRVGPEPYLLGKHGAAYRSYTASVGRFIPSVGLMR